MLDVILVRVDLRTEPTLWCFAFNSRDNELKPAQELKTLEFDGLIGTLPLSLLHPYSNLYASRA